MAAELCRTSTGDDAPQRDAIATACSPIAAGADAASATKRATRRAPRANRASTLTTPAAQIAMIQAFVLASVVRLAVVVVAMLFVVTGSPVLPDAPDFSPSTIGGASCFTILAEGRAGGLVDRGASADRLAIATPSGR
ncbi:MAG TPA: hypothetical protein VM915_07260 [Verrucomicrobiae bacterium]|nr:hypothetical protein [Verrucomicrobiae bacterium]